MAMAKARSSEVLVSYGLTTEHVVSLAYVHITVTAGITVTGAPRSTPQPRGAARP